LRNITLTSLLLTALAALIYFGFEMSPVVRAQTEPGGSFRVGERLTYNISLNKFRDVAYAETNVLSKGKIGGKDAYEVRSKLRSLNFLAVGSQFSDVTRTTFISAADGSALVVKNVDNSTGIPADTSINFIEKYPGSFDLTAIIFKIRNSGGVGSYSMFENEKAYTVAFQSIGTETVKSDAGEFPTNIIEVKSDYLTENGFLGLKISITSDGSNIPVQFRLKRGKKDEYVGLISSIQVPAEPTTPTPPVATVQTPRPTPAPTAKPPAYVDNQALNALPFELGESLEYAVTSGQRPVGTIVLAAKERKLVNNRDSLLLSATVTGATGSELWGVGNSIRTNVDPDTLAPFDLAIGFSGPLAVMNQAARFDPEASRVTLPNRQQIDVPVGTHNILSLVYALRLFNLNPSKDAGNRVNDTRVSVFWQGRSNIFTLRPAVPQVITIGDQKLLAQQISVSTGNPQLDALQIKVWLGGDDRRIPLRFSIGAYRFDLKLASAGIQP
jgi:hypothetical protein